MPPNGRLNSLLQRNANSLDFIRFAAAVAVIFSHAYPYALGASSQRLDPLFTLSSGVFTTGTLAVAVFFAISGFLVTASLDRSGSAWTYVKGRILRIYPGLIVLVVLTIFILGPLVTSLSLSDYFRQAQTYDYFQVLLLANVLNHALPGVFATKAYPSLLNGSLWTLFWEVLCYVFILILWLAKLLRRYAVLGLWIGVIGVDLLITSLSSAHPDVPTLHLMSEFYVASGLANLFTLTGYFFAGTVFYLFRDQLVMKRRLLLLGLVTLIICLAVAPDLLKLWFVTFGAYALFYAAISQRSPFKGFGRYGDFSYGLYIYAPLVQQSLVYLFGGTMQPMVNFALAAPITLIFGLLSWHLIEKPALKLKHSPLGVQSRKTLATAVQGLDRS